jgi:hypothetical protein
MFIGSFNLFSRDKYYPLFVTDKQADFWQTARIISDTMRVVVAQHRVNIGFAYPIFRKKHALQPL